MSVVLFHLLVSIALFVGGSFVLRLDIIDGSVLTAVCELSVFGISHKFIRFSMQYVTANQLKPQRLSSL